MRSPIQLLLAILAASISLTDATPSRPIPIDLMPRSSPQPCPQRYVCPQPLPFDPIQWPDQGTNPGPDRFKCRIGTSSNDPDFAFCIYEKNTGNLVASTPPGIQNLCWEEAIPNPECATPTRRRALPVRPRLAEAQQQAAHVEMGMFKSKRELEA